MIIKVVLLWSSGSNEGVKAAMVQMLHNPDSSFSVEFRCRGKGLVLVDNNAVITSITSDAL